MDNQPLSPIPVFEGTIQNPLSFPDAVKEIIKGNRIARLEWNNTDYGVLKDGYLIIYRNGEFFKWLVSDGDLLATDWIVLTELN